MKSKAQYFDSIVLEVTAIGYDGRFVGMSEKFTQQSRIVIARHD
jgi:hypothetical protein